MHFNNSQIGNITIYMLFRKAEKKHVARSTKYLEASAFCICWLPEVIQYFISAKILQKLSLTKPSSGRAYFSVTKVAQ